MRDTMLVLDSKILNLHGNDVGESLMVKNIIITFLNALVIFKTKNITCEWETFYKTYLDDAYVNFLSCRSDYIHEVTPDIVHFVVSSDTVAMSTYHRFIEVAEIIGLTYIDQLLPFLKNYKLTENSHFRLDYIEHDRTKLVLKIRERRGL